MADAAGASIEGSGTESRSMSFASRHLAFLAAVAVLPACGAGGGAPATPSGGLVLGASVAYIGTTNACALQLVNCVRAPDTAGNFVSLSQSANASNYQVSSADPTIAGGIVVMQGPGGQGDPAVELIGYSAGTTTLTISGANGASASLPITITTISALTVTLNGLPTAKSLRFSVQAPPGAQCPGFQGGYSFSWGLSSSSVTLRNFPAMGAGSLGACVFSTIEVVALDAANNTLADKTFHVTIALGHDNSTTLVVP
jgi:hypothetical protein